MKSLLYLSFVSFFLSTSSAAPIQDVSARSIEAIRNTRITNPVLHGRQNDADADVDVVYTDPGTAHANFVAGYRKLHPRQDHHDNADADADIVYTAPGQGRTNTWARRNSLQRRQDDADADVDIVYTAPLGATPNSRAFKPWSRRDDNGGADADANVVYTALGGTQPNA